MAEPLPLPSASNCLTPLIESLVADKPARLEHINYGDGNWSNVLAGWKAQATLNLRRAADEMMQARLPLASGKGLRELAASKFFANVVDVPTKAIGQTTLVYAGPVGASGFWIPAGTRFRRNADPRAVPVPILAADYRSLEAVWVPYNIAPGTQLLVPIECISPGTAGNIVVEVFDPAGSGLPGTDLEIVDQLPQAFTVHTTTCAGGGTSFSDPEVRAIAGAQPQGRRGPTDGAILAGAYLATGVRHAAVFDDLAHANTVVFVADESWGSDSTYWQPAVLQALLGDGETDAWAGFGCSLNPNGAGLVNNLFLRVSATIQLRAQNLLQQTADVRAKIEAKLRDYFQLRPDWYTFRSSAIRGLISRADPRVLTCTSVTITDRFGNAVTDPAAIPYGTAPSALTHYAMQAFVPTFVVPA